MAGVERRRGNTTVTYGSAVGWDDERDVRRREPSRVAVLNDSLVTWQKQRRLTPFFVFGDKGLLGLHVVPVVNWCCGLALCTPLSTPVRQGRGSPLDFFDAAARR